MSDDLTRKLRQFQRYTQQLGDMIAEAQRSAPAQAEGRDSSRSVTVVVGADGLPESIRVAATWAQRLEPAAFGRAVVEAGKAALVERMTAWGKTLEETNWQRKVDRLDVPQDQGPQQAAPGVVPPAFRRDAQRPPRPLEVVTEDMIRAFDQVPTYARAPKLAAKGTGSAARGALVITLTAGGIESCDAQLAWVSRQDSGQLNGALATALADARARLAQAAAAPAPTEPLAELFGEVLAMFEDPKRLGGR